MNSKEKNKFIIPIAIIVASIILGGSYFSVQISKLKFSERQEMLKLNEEEKNKREERLDREECYNEASEAAKNMLKTKVELGANKYDEAAEKDLFLIDDFENFYEYCLSKKGLE